MKILVVGDKEVGKTTFVRTASGEISLGYLRRTACLGIHKTTFLRNEFKTTLTFWDIDSQELHDNVKKLYYKDAQGAFIVIDGSKPSCAKKWLTDLRSNWEFPLEEGKYPIILLVTKTDLVNNIADHFASYEHFRVKNSLYDWKPVSIYDYSSVRNACDAMIDMCRLFESPEKEEVTHCKLSPDLSNVSLIVKEKSIYDLFLKDFFVALNKFPETDAVKFLHAMLLVLFFDPSLESLRERIKSDNQSKKIIGFVVNKLSSKTEDKDKIIDVRIFLLSLGLDSLKIS